MGSQYSVYIARRKVKISNEDKMKRDNMKLRNGEVIKNDEPLLSCGTGWGRGLDED